jgi:hypothetical protein
MTGGRGEGGAALTPPPGESPIVVLVRPQMAANIGTAARAMANGGLFPPADRGAARRLAAAQCLCRRVGGGCHPRRRAALPRPAQRARRLPPRLRHLPAAAPRHHPNPRRPRGGEELRAVNARDLRVAVLFGPERAGLEADDLAHCDTLVRYPLNPQHNSLNLAQAVMILAYEWWMHARRRRRGNS